MPGEADDHHRPFAWSWDAGTTGDLAAWLGQDASDAQVDALGAYAHWLADEARGAGGIGPAEVPRLFDRHIGDSLAYLVGMPRHVSAIVDIGSGVGLPGIPLAIMHPTVAVTLVDRSGRRSDLARRAVRVLGLDNVEVMQADVEREDLPSELGVVAPRGADAQVADALVADEAVADAPLAGSGPRRTVVGVPVLVFRASLPIARAYGVLADVFGPILGPNGVGLFGVSRAWVRPDVPKPPAGLATHLVRIAPPMLDSPFWLLRMQGTSG
jgi:hypothetical protein